MPQQNFVSKEFPHMVSELFKPELVAYIREENKGILAALEEAGLNYMEV